MVIKFQRLIYEKLGFHTANNISKMFSMLGLPEPSEGAFLPANDGGLLFLNDYGVVIRFEHRLNSIKKTCFTHPAILQPLAVLETGNTRIEICPGVKLAKGLKPHEMEYIVNSLAADGLELTDPNYQTNFGYLPMATPEFPDGIPVLIDREGKSVSLKLDVSGAKGFVGALVKPSSQSHDWDANSSPYTLMQEMLYTPLQRAFQKAWPEGKAYPDTIKLAEFWSKCRLAQQMHLPDMPPEIQASEKKKPLFPSSLLNSGWREASHNITPFEFASHLLEKKKTPKEYRVNQAAKFYAGDLAASPPEDRLLAKHRTISSRLQPVVIEREISID